MIYNFGIAIGMLKTYLQCPKGATAIEYGLVAAGIALAISGAVLLFGDAVKTLLYDDLPSALPPQ